MQPKLTQEQRDKLFSKLDLTGYDDWTQDQHDAMDDVIEHYHHIFAVEDLELGRTDLVKHEIKLTNLCRKTWYSYDIWGVGGLLAWNGWWLECELEFVDFQIV